MRHNTAPILEMSAFAARFKSAARLFPAKTALSRAPPAAGEVAKAASLTRSRATAVARVSHLQLKENWLDSLSCPFPLNGAPPAARMEEAVSDLAPGLVLGIDPDVSGAVALLRSDGSGCCPQVFDSPHLKVLVGKRVRRRLDARSIVQLIQSFGAPHGTMAYIEQSNPFPQDGKQGWWSGGYTYGLWIGILVASGFTVVPVTSLQWKDHFELCRSSSSKDDSREAASTLFPSLSSLLKRKKDHGRAEALLIAAYGLGLKMPLEPNSSL